jgi:hypothetical protein
MGVAELRVPVGVPLVVEKISPAPFWKDSYIDAYLNHKPRDLKEMSLGMLDPKTIVWAVDGKVVSLPSPGGYKHDMVQVISFLGVGWICEDHLSIPR